MYEVASKVESDCDHNSGGKKTAQFDQIEREGRVLKMRCLSTRLRHPGPLALSLEMAMCLELALKDAENMRDQAHRHRLL